MDRYSADEISSTIVDVNEMIERFGRGFLFASDTGYLFYCFNGDKDYYRFKENDIHESDDGVKWSDIIKSDMDGRGDLEFLNLPKFFFSVSPNIKPDSI